MEKIWQLLKKLEHFRVKLEEVDNGEEDHDPHHPLTCLNATRGFKLTYQKYVRTYEKAERPGRLAMSKQTKNISREILLKKTEFQSSNYS